MKCFISHMVQMKEGKGCLKLPTMKYFISHMVQMKDKTTEAFLWGIFLLYIPHGSDESASVQTQ